MSNFLIKRALQRKLDQVNSVIDTKIINGKSYRRESKLHRSIQQQMNLLVRLPGAKSIF